MLTENQIVVAEEIMKGELEYSEIAEKYGICRKTLYNWRQDQEFKEKLAELEKDCIEETKTALKMASIKAYKKLIKCLDSPNSKVSLDAARDILDRAGLSVAQNIKFGVDQPTEPDKLSIDIIKARLQTRQHNNDK